MSINSIRLSAYGFRMEAVGSKKFIKRERDAFLEFAAGRVNETAQKLAEAVCAEPLHPFCNCAMPGVDSDQEHEKSKDTGKELNITHKYKKTFTLDELRALIRNGEIQNHVSVGDTIWIMFDGKEVPYDVIGFDVEELADKTLDHSMTIQAHVAIEAREFDTKGDYGSNVWADSELREYLQSDEFKERFADLIPYLAKVKKNNSNGEQTEDLFFLLSKEEFDPEETPYEFYENKANRVKFTEDGFNMNIVRNHIIYDKRKCQEELEEKDYPKEYFRETPPQVDNYYMARMDEIRENAKSSLMVYKADENYIFIMQNLGKLNERQKEQCHIGAVMGYITGLQSFINGNDYVGMRRHERPERYQDSFKYCRKQIEEYLKEIPKEKVLPTGQLTLFDLFDMSGG